MLLAVPFRAQSENLNNLRQALEPGQILVDCTVPTAAAVGGKATRSLGVWQGSAAQQVAAIVEPEVARYIQLHAGEAGGHRVAAYWRGFPAAYGRGSPATRCRGTGAPLVAAVGGAGALGMVLVLARWDRVARRRGAHARVVDLGDPPDQMPPLVRLQELDELLLRPGRLALRVVPDVNVVGVTSGARYEEGGAKYNTDAGGQALVNLVVAFKNDWP